MITPVAALWHQGPEVGDEAAWGPYLVPGEWKLTPDATISLLTSWDQEDKVATIPRAGGSGE